MEDVPHLLVWHATLDEYPRSPAIRQHALFSEVEAYQKERNDPYVRTPRQCRAHTEGL